MADSATPWWLGGPDGVLAFHRGNFACTLTLSGKPVPVINLPGLASVPLIDGRRCRPTRRSGPQACREPTRPPSTPCTKAGESSVDSSATRCTASDTTTAGGRSV